MSFSLPLTAIRKLVVIVFFTSLPMIAAFFLTAIPVKSQGGNPYIFTDDFSTDRGWELYQDLGAGMEIAGGKFRLRQGEPYRNSRVFSPMLNNFSIEVDVEGVSPNTSVGIVFDRKYDNYYSFEIMPNEQQYKITKNITDDIILASGFSQFITPAKNHLEVRREGESIKVYVNSNLIADLTNGDLHGVEAGLAVVSSDTASQMNIGRAVFSSFIVSSLDKQTKKYEDSFVFARDWTFTPDSGGLYELANGQMHISQTQPSKRFHIYYPLFPYSIEVEGTIELDSAGRFGMIFDFYETNYFNRFVILPSTQEYLISKYRPNEGFTDYKKGTSSAILPSTSVNKLSIYRNGALLKAFINDQLVTEVMVEGFLPSIGLMVGSSPTDAGTMLSGHLSVFDNFKANYDADNILSSNPINPSVPPSATPTPTPTPTATPLATPKYRLYSDILASYGQQNSQQDRNADGVVDLFDINHLLTEFFVQ